MNTGEYVSVDEFADLSGLSHATVRRRCVDGSLGAIKVGKQWMIPATSLEVASIAISPATADSTVISALKHVRSQDLTELWVPDVLRFDDALSRIEPLLDIVDAKLNRRMPPDRPEIVEVPKTRTSSRRGVLLTLGDRIAYQAVVESFALKLDSIAGPTIFSARLGGSRGRLLKKGNIQWAKFSEQVLKDARGSSGRYVGSTDLVSYFDTVQHGILFRQLMDLGTESGSIALLRDMLDSWSALPGQGLPQGPDASRILGNLYLAPVDQAMLQGPWRYYRYLDDVRIVADSERDVLRALRLFERECRALGLIASVSKTKCQSSIDYVRNQAEPEIAAAAYAFDMGNELRGVDIAERLLEAELNGPSMPSVRRKRFALWKLARQGHTKFSEQVLEQFDEFVPVASVAAAYVVNASPEVFGSRALSRLVRQVAEDETDDYTAAWIMILLSEYTDREVRSAWVDAARHLARDRNRPNYLRGIAMLVLGRGRYQADIGWLDECLRGETDQYLCRTALVAMARGRLLTRSRVKMCTDRFPGLRVTGEFLLGAKVVRSLLDPARKIEV